MHLLFFSSRHRLLFCRTCFIEGNFFVRRRYRVEFAYQNLNLFFGFGGIIELPSNGRFFLADMAAQTFGQAGMGSHNLKRLTDKSQMSNCKSLLFNSGEERLSDAIKCVAICFIASNASDALRRH